MEKPSSFFGRNKNIIAWILRIVISILFILSAITKMVTGDWEMAKSLWMFEKQLVDLGICGWCVAHYLARLLIGFELALGIAILFPYLIKKLVVPVTILLLAAFCVHLGIQMIEYGPTAGNCGCFGQAIPMTPIEAFIKNIITIGLLIWLWRLLSSANEKWKNIIYPMSIFLACALFMFMAFPFSPCGKKKADDFNQTTFTDTTISTIPNVNTANTNNSDTASMLTSAKDLETKKKNQDSIKKAEALAKSEAEKLTKETSLPKAASGPKKVVSKFTPYATFSGKKVNINDGKKVVCLFDPDCDHCQETAKQIGELGKNQKIPEVYIFFMNQMPEKIPNFFKVAGAKFPYKVVEIPDFWTLLGDGNTPGVFSLWNGNVEQTFEGILENEFDIEKFKEFAIEK